MMHELLEAQCSFFIRTDTTSFENQLFVSVNENENNEVCVLKNKSRIYSILKYSNCGNFINETLIIDTFSELNLEVDFYQSQIGYPEAGLDMSNIEFRFIATDFENKYLISSDYKLKFKSVLELNDDIRGHLFFLSRDRLCEFSLDGKNYIILDLNGNNYSTGTVPNNFEINNPIKVKMDIDSSIYLLSSDNSKYSLFKFEKNFKSLLWNFKDSCLGSNISDFIINDDEVIVVGNTCTLPNEYEPILWTLSKGGSLKSSKILKAGIKFNRPTINKIVWSDEGFYYAVGSRSYRVGERTQFFFTKLSKDFNVLWDVDFKAASAKKFFDSKATKILPSRDGGLLCSGYNSVVRYDSLQGNKAIEESYLIKVSSDGKITSLGDKLKLDPKQKVIEQNNSDHLILKDDLISKRYRLVNYTGQEIQSGVVSDVIDISRLHSGYYYIQVIDEQYRVVGAEGFVVE